MKSLRSQYMIVTAIFSLMFSGCVTAPFGPTVKVMPAPGKPFELFQQEQKDCKAYAFEQMGGQEAVNNANATAFTHGLVGTLLGAGAGSAIGAGSGNAAAGAEVGTGVGAVAGTASGARNSKKATAQLQRLYNDAFEQCMFAKGNQVPVAIAETPPPIAPPPPEPVVYDVQAPAPMVVEEEMPAPPIVYMEPVYLPPPIIVAYHYDYFVYENVGGFVNIVFFENGQRLRRERWEENGHRMTPGHVSAWRREHKVSLAAMEHNRRMLEEKHNIHHPDSHYGIKPEQRAHLRKQQEQAVRQQQRLPAIKPSQTQNGQRQPTPAQARTAQPQPGQQQKIKPDQKPGQQKVVQKLPPQKKQVQGQVQGKAAPKQQKQAPPPKKKLEDEKK